MVGHDAERVERRRVEARHVGMLHEVVLHDPGRDGRGDALDEGFKILGLAVGTQTSVHNLGDDDLPAATAVDLLEDELLTLVMLADEVGKRARLHALRRRCAHAEEVVMHENALGGDVRAGILAEPVVQVHFGKELAARNERVVVFQRLAERAERGVHIPTELAEGLQVQPVIAGLGVGAVHAIEVVAGVHFAVFLEPIEKVGFAHVARLAIHLGILRGRVQNGLDLCRLSLVQCHENLFSLACFCLIILYPLWTRATRARRREHVNSSLGRFRLSCAAHDACTCADWHAP